MPILSNKHAPHSHPKSTIGTSTTRFQVFQQLKKFNEQFEKVERAYLEENKVNMDRCVEKFHKLISASYLFTIDFLEDEVIVISIRRGAEGMKDLRFLLNQIQFHESDHSDDKLHMALLKNFCEQFMEWARTYKSEPPPGFVPQFNRGRVNLLKREPGRHKYGS